MGTLLSRRRYMGGGGSSPSYDEKSYVQDGLIFQLDGIAKGATDGTWVDLVDGLVLEQSGTVQPLTNGWYFDGSCKFTVSSVLDRSIDNTVEACVQLDSGSGNGIFHSGGNTIGYPLLFVVSSNLLFLQRGKYAQGSLGTRVKNGNPISLSLNQDRCLGNSNTYALSSGTNFYTSGAGTTEVGMYNNNYMKGTVHAIRVYSRRLTEAEQKWNIMVDSKRFGFSL